MEHLRCFVTLCNENVLEWKMVLIKKNGGKFNERGKDAIDK